jgi:hypothetical protein
MHTSHPFHAPPTSFFLLGYVMFIFNNKVELYIYIYIFKIVLLHVTLCIVTTLAMAVFEVTAVGISDLTYEAPHFSLSSSLLVHIFFLAPCS